MTLTPELEAKFEAIGVETVRRDIGMGFVLVTDAEQAAAIKWVAAKDKAKEFEVQRYSNRTLGWTITAAIAGIIAAILAAVAAWPVVKDIFL